MKLRCAPLFVVLSLILSGCIITYRDFPEAKIVASTPAKTLPKVYFSLDTPDPHFDQLFESLIRDHSYFAGVERILDLSRSPTPESAVPKKGFYLRIQFVQTPVSPVRKFWIVASAATLSIIPYWSSDAGYASQLGEPTRNPSFGNKIRFVLFENGNKLKEYEYKYREVIGAFILLAPFAWINFFTHYGDDVLTSLFNQFLDDAQPLISAEAPNIK